jgi:2-(1,2-epoxy-1,2-dihydrophenyl)acetyl-CoA isomerase
MSSRIRNRLGRNPVTYETLTYSTGSGLCRVTLNRPERRNGITNAMVREVHTAMATAAGDASVRVLVLTGAGGAFCVGADLDHFASTETEEPVSADLFSIAALLHEMPAVTVAAINGACAGAGLGWALACDLRVISASAKLNTAFLDVALAGDMGIPWSLPRLVGAGRARDWSFRPRRVGADEALVLGLASEVFPDDSFKNMTGELVKALLRKAPSALRGMKQNYLAAERLPLGEFVELEAHRHLGLMTGPDATEAVRAYVEKREPKFG